MTGVQNRDLFGLWLNERGLIGTGAEIGCAFGGYSRIVLSQWKGKRYYMVDPWEKQDPAVYKESTNEQASFGGWFDDCRLLAREDDRVVLMRMLSEKAAPWFLIGDIDWVYIDGNHAYDAVIQDMDLWWAKVKPGGIMGGHDFYNRKTDGFFVEVESAVSKWAKDHGVSFYVTPCTSWWIEK